MRKHSKVLLIVPYPLGQAPSQRFRFEQYLLYLGQAGIETKIAPFWTENQWKLINSESSGLAKAAALFSSMCRRVLTAIRAARFDIIFIHREVTPIGPPIIEWFIAKVLSKKIIYDFDDAIWLTDNVNESATARILRCRSKVRSICKMSWRISCGNAFLSAFASNYNNNVIIIPTTIDTDNVHNQLLHGKIHGDRVVIGWTGSHSTLKYLLLIETVLQEIENRFPEVDILVIADRPPPLKLKRLRFIPWNKTNEAADLMLIDIGIMPLPDDQWSKGKCGFKLLQYLALGIPAVASAVGANVDILTEEIDGYLVNNDNEWINKLTALIRHPNLRSKLGRNGREKVQADYSVDANKKKYLHLFHE